MYSMIYKTTIFGTNILFVDEKYIKVTGKIETSYMYILSYGLKNIDKKNLLKVNL